MNPVNKILFGLGAAVVLIITVAFVWLSLANAYLKTELAESQANDTACHLANDEFAAKAAAQNRAVAQLRDESLAHEKRAQEAVREAQKSAQVFLKAADKLRKTNMHGDACKTSEALLDDYIGGGK
jgi:hypothetical protein